MDKVVALNEVLDITNVSKREYFVFKVDFEKACGPII